MFMTYVHIKFHIISHTVAKFVNNIQNSTCTFCVCHTVSYFIKIWPAWSYTFSKICYNINRIPQQVKLAMLPYTKSEQPSQWLSVMDVLNCKHTAASNCTMTMFFMNLSCSLVVIMEESHQDLLT